MEKRYVILLDTDGCEQVALGNPVHQWNYLLSEISSPTPAGYLKLGEVTLAAPNRVDAARVAADVLQRRSDPMRAEFSEVAARLRELTSRIEALHGVSGAHQSAAERQPEAVATAPAVEAAR